jgi:hypothetical protein
MTGINRFFYVNLDKKVPHGKNLTATLLSFFLLFINTTMHHNIPALPVFDAT